MISRALIRRLRHLEERLGTIREPTVHVLHFVDGDGTISGSVTFRHGDSSEPVWSEAPQMAAGDT